MSHPNHSHRFYRFEEVDAGETYNFAATAKGYAFDPKTITVADDLTDVDFVAR